MSYIQTEQAVYRYGPQLNIDYTPDSDVAAGDIIDLGTFAGIALEKIVAGQTGVLCIRGVFDVLKPTDTAVDLGAVVLWDDTANVAYVTGGGYSDDLCLGKCVQAALDTDPTVRVSVIETAVAVLG